MPTTYRVTLVFNDDTSNTYDTDIYPDISKLFNDNSNLREVIINELP